MSARRLGVTWLVALMPATGCTSQQVYDSTRSLRMRDCEKLALSEREQCLADARLPFLEAEKRERNRP